MYCGKCGAPNPDSGKFCTTCGAALSGANNKAENNQMPALVEESASSVPDTVQTTKNDTVQAPKMKAPGKTEPHCPKCKSTNLQTVTKTEVSGGYGAGRGCLGWLLFGPLGFLCGSSKVQATNKLAFICMGCGFRFKRLEDLIKELEGTKDCLISVIEFAVMGWGIFSIFQGINKDSVLKICLGIFALFVISYIIDSWDQGKFSKYGMSNPRADEINLLKSEGYDADGMLDKFQDSE